MLIAHLADFTLFKLLLHYTTRLTLMQAARESAGAFLKFREIKSKVFLLNFAVELKG